jgi:hypothetical protein
MKSYHLFIGLLMAGMFLTVSFPAKVVAASVNIELEAGDPPTAKQCLILKAAADATPISYADMLDGYVRGAVLIVDLPDNHYCVQYGEGHNDFIILDLEED